MERIGKYEVLDQIGSGGFATVYKGYDPFIKRPVAIKVCNSRDGESRQRFYREAEIVGSLTHRNITAVYDFGVHDDQPYLVEEYLPGEDLAQLVRRQEPSDLGLRLDFLAQIASGLEYAHQQGVIHRDIKPSNVRVLGDGRIKIMDFGTAKLANVESHLTQAGMTLGTVAYLSPERLLGKPSGTNSDIFSYGVLAYEVLSFRRPFSGRNIPGLIDQVLNAAPTPLADTWPECPPKLAELVHRCLFKDPGVRYASCGEVMADLEQVILDTTGRVPVGLLNEQSSSIAIQQTSVQISGLIERARALIKKDRPQRAELMLEEVLDIAPKNAEAKQLLDLCRDQISRASGPIASPSAAAPSDTVPVGTAPVGTAPAGTAPAGAGAVPPAGSTSIPETPAAGMDASPGTEGFSYEGPDERKERKRAEAVASINRYIEEGEVLSAIEALRFASRLFGPIDEALTLRRRTMERARYELASLKGHAERTRRQLVDAMIQLRQQDQLTVDVAEQITARVLEFDPEDLAARDLLEIARQQAPAQTSEKDERQKKLDEAIASIEGLLSSGDAQTAARALEFAVGLFGEFDAAAALRARIDSALSTAS